MGFGDLTVSHGLVGERGDVALVKVTGEVDVYTAPTVRDYLRVELLEVAEPPAHVGLELSRVEWFDSTALGVCVGFLKHYRRVRPAGVVAIVAPAPKVRRLWEVAGLATVFPTVDLPGFLPLLEERGRPGENAENLCA